MDLTTVTMNQWSKRSIIYDQESLVKLLISKVFMENHKLSPLASNLIGVPTVRLLVAESCLIKESIWLICFRIYFFRTCCSNTSTQYIATNNKIFINSTGLLQDYKQFYFRALYVFRSTMFSLSEMRKDYILWLLGQDSNLRPID